jgi:hypothetical protein
VAALKGWPDNETKLVDQTFPVWPGNQVHWTGP